MNVPKHWREIGLLDRLAHDLRGPLTPLQTASYLLRSGQVDSEQKQELLAVIERQTRRLGRMLEELSDWTRIGEDRLLGSRGPCEPVLLLDYARTAISTGTDMGKLARIVDDTGDVAVVDGDPSRLTQLLRILLEYSGSREGTDAPSVSLRIEGQRLCIDIRDAGSAPDAAACAILFEEPQPEPYDEGLGLQLLIARAITEAHAGTLAALDDGGQLVLHCELPLAAGQVKASV